MRYERITYTDDQGVQGDRYLKITGEVRTAAGLLVHGAIVTRTGENPWSGEWHTLIIPEARIVEREVLVPDLWYQQGLITPAQAQANRDRALAPHRANGWTWDAREGCWRADADRSLVQWSAYSDPPQAPPHIWGQCCRGDR